MTRRSDLHRVFSLGRAKRGFMGAVDLCHTLTDVLHQCLRRTLSLKPYLQAAAEYNEAKPGIQLLQALVTDCIEEAF
jgi:hypothetical protein